MRVCAEEGKKAARLGWALLARGHRVLLAHPPDVELPEGSLFPFTPAFFPFRFSRRVPGRGTGSSCRTEASDAPHSRDAFQPLALPWDALLLLPSRRSEAIPHGAAVGPVTWGTHVSTRTCWLPSMAGFPGTGAFRAAGGGTQMSWSWLVSAFSRHWQWLLLSWNGYGGALAGICNPPPWATWP